MNYVVYLLLILAAVWVVSTLRRRRDEQLLAEHVRSLGGRLIRLERVRRGSPFPDTSRGWWAWRVYWQSEAGERASWALTTRDGLGEWRD